MAAATVLYFVQERTEVVAGSFALSSSECADGVRLPVIRSHFPYSGAFHFRAKVQPSSVGENLPWKSLWKDLTSDQEQIPIFDKDVIILKALPLFDTTLPEPSSEATHFSWNAQQFLDWMVRRCQLCRRSRRCVAP